MTAHNPSDETPDALIARLAAAAREAAAALAHAPADRKQAALTNPEVVSPEKI